MPLVANAALLGVMADAWSVLQVVGLAAVLVLLVWRIGRGGGT